jgi:heme-degrading monooxygenase HmoA
MWRHSNGSFYKSFTQHVTFCIWSGQKWKICTLYRDGNKDIKTYEGAIGIELLKVSNKDRYVFFSFFSFDHIKVYPRSRNPNTRLNFVSPQTFSAMNKASNYTCGDIPMDHSTNHLHNTKLKMCTLYRDGNKDIKTYEGAIGIELLKVSNKDRYVFFPFSHLIIFLQPLCLWIRATS